VERAESKGAGSMAQIHREAPASPWIGMAVFGGIMMIVVGSFHLMAGLVGIFNDQYYLVTSNELLVSVDYTAWGWAHLLLGAAAIAAGAGIFSGRSWAIVTGVILAVLSALVNVAFLAAYPVWSVMIIALDVLVIYALIAHGEELKT
jgi:hypothetical protein